MMCTMNFNEEHKGIELTFAAKPEDVIREALKAAGYRWHSQKKLWYARQNEARMALAQKLAGDQTAAAQDAGKVIQFTGSAEDKPAAAAPDETISKFGIKAGDILYDSWGYEQTNVEFYIVTKIVSACKIEIQELGHSEVDGSGCGMSCDVMPDPEKRIGEPIQKIVSQSGYEKASGHWHVKINDSVSLTAWDGRPKYKSWYY